MVKVNVIFPFIIVNLLNSSRYCTRIDTLLPWRCIPTIFLTAAIPEKYCPTEFYEICAHQSCSFLSRLLETGCEILLAIAKRELRKPTSDDRLLNRNLFINYVNNIIVNMLVKQLSLKWKKMFRISRVFIIPNTKEHSMLFETTGTWNKIS